MSSLLKSDYLKLVLILALAFYLAFIPHSGFPYPVHVDEWFHWAYASEVMSNAGTSGITNPFSGGPPVWNQKVEVGFHVFWGIFQQVTGISWLFIIKYFPAAIFMLTVISVYVLARREGFGWEAAFFTCLIPTTIGVLGPGFLVPMALGLFFIPLALFIVLNLRGWQSYVMLFILNCFLVLMHGATAVCLLIILVPYILLYLKRDFRRVATVMAVLVIPFVAPFPWIFRIVMNKATSLFSYQPLPQYVDLPRDFSQYGYLPTILFIIGTFWLIRSGTRKGHALAFGALVMLAVIVVFVRLHIGLDLVYLRGFVILLLMMSIVAGCGLWLVRRISFSSNPAARFRFAFITRHLGSILCLLLAALTLVIAIPTRQSIPYYHMVDARDYNAFVWIAENLDESYDKALLDPWQATAFTAVTGRKVYSRIIMFPREKAMKARQFLDAGCTDTSFLRRNGISIVYSRRDCNNPDLVEVRRYVYLLEDRGAP